MRIFIMLNSLAIGGVQRVALDDAVELARRGHSVVLITTEAAAGSSYAAEARAQKYEWREIIFSSTWDWSAGKKFWRLLREQKPDLMITHMWFANNVGRLAAWLCAVPKILTFEHSIYDEIKPRRQFFADWCLQFISTKIIAVSQAVKRSLILHGIWEAKIIVVPNGVAAEKFLAPVGQRTAVRAEWGFSENDFVFIFVGRLCAEKNVSEIITALAQIPEAKLVIVGDGGERERLAELAKSVGVSDRVRFLGMRENVAGQLAAADSLLLASRSREGFGLVLLEAMASKSSVITRHYAAAEEIIVDGFNGLMYESVDELVTAMRRIKSDSDLREKLIAGGIQTAANFTVARQVDKLLKI